MGKGLPRQIKKGNASMPFKASDASKSKKPSTPKQKQRAWVHSGLRALQAPMARLLKSLVGNPHHVPTRFLLKVLKVGFYIF